MFARNVIVVVALAVALLSLTVWRKHAKQAAQQRELAKLVAALGPFAGEVSKASATINSGAKLPDVFEAMESARKALDGVERPTTDSPRVDRLYDLARDVERAVQHGTDRAVRGMGAARGDAEHDQALLAGVQKLVADYQAAAGAFLADYAAAQRDVAAQNK